MEKPSRKLKKTLLITGITGAVYLSFEYLLPLVIPFLIAYLFALALRPPAVWLERRIKLRIGSRVRHIPLSLIGAVEIIWVMAIAGAFLYIGCRKLFLESRMLLDAIPQMISELDRWLTSNCHWTEDALHLPGGSLVRLLREMLRGGGNALKETAMPFLMLNSVTVIRYVVQITVMTVILFIATILSLQEMDTIRIRRDNSLFRHEFALLGNRLVNVGSAWLKTQGSIMLFTMTICTAGLFLLRNPYSVLLGIVIGLLDALPIFGTGTVLIPWAAVQLIRGELLYGAGLLAIYIICYFLRQIMEAKIMAGKVGLSPLETLISMYIGLQLFGILGFILGPIGLLIIEDLVEMYEGREKCRDRVV